MTTRIVERDIRLARPQGAWRDLSAQLTRAITEHTMRRDLVVRIAPGAGHGAPACLIPPKATVEVDGNHFGIKPEDANPADAGDRKRYAKSWGTLVHEAAHGDYTRWTRWVREKKTTKAALTAALMLEESRIESRQVKRRPQDKGWLQQSAQIVIDAHRDPLKFSTYEWAISVAGLLYSRVDGGSLDEGDLPPGWLRVMREQLLDYGSATRQLRVLEQMRDIWKQAHELEDNEDELKMLSLGARWAELIRNMDKQNATGMLSGKPEQGGSPAEGFGKPGEIYTSGGEDNEGSGTGKNQDNDNSGGKGQSRTDQKTDQQNAKSEADSAAQSRKQAGVGPGGSNEEIGLRSWRNPTPEERSAAAKLTRRLVRAGFRERAEIPRTSELPPGRVRMRAALSRDIQRDMGAVPTAEPFRHTEHRYTPTPPLAAGIITDVSGSMSKVMNPVARSSWIISRAVSMVPDARTMLVAFANNKAAPIIMPGQRPSMVPVMQALSAGNEPMTRAINMVDGCLDLSSPGKARLLIILSDDRMTLYGEPLRCTKRVRRLVASGCRVLWITFIGPRFYEQSYGGEPPYLNTIPQVRAVHVPPDMLGEELPHIIIDEVVRTLQITQ